MSWVKLDDQFYWHPKVASLPSDAFRLFVGGLCLCNSFPQMAGVILRTQVAMLFSQQLPDRKFKRAVAELVSVGLWHEVDEGWAIHDYEHYQPISKERREQLRQWGNLGGRPTKTLEVSAEKPKVIFQEPSEKAARVDPVPLPVPVPVGVIPLGNTEIHTREALAILSYWEAQGKPITHSERDDAEGCAAEFQCLTADQFVEIMRSVDTERLELKLEPMRHVAGYRKQFRYWNSKFRDEGQKNRRDEAAKAMP